MNMETLIAISGRPFEEKQLKEWVYTKGGYWVNDSLRQGVVERDLARVYISVCNEYLDELEPDGTALIERELGGRAVSAVCFTIGRSVDSEELANELVDAFCSEWEVVRSPIT